MQEDLNIVLAQLNFKVGDFEQNADKIKAAIQEAQEKGADLVVFSELAIGGYPPLALLTREDFAVRALAALEELAARCTHTAARVGGPSLNPDAKGKPLLNRAWLLYQGQATAVAHKPLLPTYDVFDEYRYFQPTHRFQVLPFKGRRLALRVCAA